MTKRLILLGGGHAHLQVLGRLAPGRLTGWEVLLVTPQPRQIYSGMLPGWIAGHYTLDQISIDLRPLVRSAGATLLLDHAVGLDAHAGFVQAREQGRLGFDALSIDVGSAGACDIPGAAQHGTSVRPIDGFVRAWERLERQLHDTCQPVRVVVLGAGPGGVELALALRHRGMKEGWSHLGVHLVGSDALPLPAVPPAAQRKALEMLRRACIRWDGTRRAVAIERERIVFEDGDASAANACWIVTGAVAAPWLAGSGLATDRAGYVQVTDTLQSVSHPHVFAAGDAASHPHALPKSGVYAVRAGGVLARNLLSFCTGERTAPFRAQTRALYLISAGERRALAVWGGWSWEGRWAGRWKDWIDRRFIKAWTHGWPIEPERQG